MNGPYSRRLKNAGPDEDALRRFRIQHYHFARRTNYTEQPAWEDYPLTVAQHA